LHVPRDAIDDPQVLRGVGAAGLPTAGEHDRRTHCVQPGVHRVRRRLSDDTEADTPECTSTAGSAPMRVAPANRHVGSS
jgi:hypothetical protein